MKDGSARLGLKVAHAINLTRLNKVEGVFKDIVIYSMRNIVKLSYIKRNIT